MSAAEHQSSNSSQPIKPSLKKPVRRPSLLQPPSRSSRPAPEAATLVTPKPSRPTTKPASEVVAKPVEEPIAPTPTLHPISPPSEPMQYRAIGLVQGIYTPSEEQLNQGCLVTEDDTVIDAVLLGRITSLVKKYIDLKTSHLWVVYPRTRVADAASEDDKTEPDLHLQIVGVWEPETLGMPGENPGADDSERTTSEETKVSEETETPTEESETSSTTINADDTKLPETTVAVDTFSPDDTEPSPTAIVNTSTVNTSTSEKPSPISEQPAEEKKVGDLPSQNYFSIRGEILKCNDDTKQIQVKIVQAAKRADKGQKAFRLHVAGQISGKTVGYFWELDVERHGKQLTLIDGHTVGIVPPKKNKKKKSGPRSGGKRPFNQGVRHKPSAPQKSKPRIRPSAPVKSNPL